MSLIFGNRSIDDILLREELESMAANNAEKFKLHFTVDIAPEDKDSWKGGVGFVTMEMLKEKMPAPGPETIVLFCGPPPFTDMMKKHLTELGYDESMWFKF